MADKTTHPEWFYGVRLTPEPDAPHSFTTRDDPITKKMKDDWHDENRKFICRALGNVVILPDYSFVDHQKRADKSRPRPEDESWRGGETIEISDSEPTFIVDADGVVGGLVIPCFAKDPSLSNMTRNASAFAQLELANAMAKVRQNIDPKLLVSWHKKCDDRYLILDGSFGDIHLCKAWHPRGHQYSDFFAPSREFVGSTSNIQLANRFLYMDSLEATAFRVNDLVAQAFPALSALLRSTAKPLARHPIIHAINNVWHSDFLGHALLMNKQSGEHLDVNGVRRAWDVLLASGKFSGGHLFLKDMNVRIPFPAGTLVAFDGTAQRHAIESFEGPQRISSVFFIHASVFSQLNIDTTLPDLTTTMVMNSLAQQSKRRRDDDNGTEAPVEKKRKKRGGRGKGRRFAAGSVS